MTLTNSTGPGAACDAGSVESGAAVTASVRISPAGDRPCFDPGRRRRVHLHSHDHEHECHAADVRLLGRAIRPDGAATTTLYGPGSVTLGSGASVTRTLTQRLSRPLGLYRYDFFVGTFSTQTVNGADSIAISKTRAG